MQTACYSAVCMPKAIQIRDVPDDVHRKLKVRAAEEGRTLSELLREELVDLAERPTLAQMMERLQARSSVEISESSADAIRAGRPAD